MLHGRPNILLIVCYIVSGYVVATGAGDHLLELDSPSEVEPPHQELLDSRARVDMSDEMYNTLLDCCLLDGGSMMCTFDCDHTDCTAPTRLLNCTHISTAAAPKLLKLETGNTIISIGR